MLRVKKVSEAVGKPVYTSDGDFFGQVEEVNLIDNKIDGWKIKIGSSFMNLLGGARGVIVPHQFVKAIGDVFIVNKSSLPIRDDVGFSEPTTSENSQSAGSSGMFSGF